MKHILEVKYNEETEDYYLEFPQDVLDQVGWKPGDVLDWKDNGNGSFTLQKKMEDQASDTAQDGPVDGATQS